MSVSRDSLDGAVALVAPLPPARRSRAALGLTAAAAVGRFELQTCRDCGAVQYPPREACCRCLSVRLDWRAQSDKGELLAPTTLRHSHEPFFRKRLPWHVGLIRLDCGPSIVAHLHGALSSPGAPVRVSLRLDRAGCAVLFAFPREEVSDMADDRQLQDLSCDPKSRKVLVTDACSATGIALIHALCAADAKTVWAGHAEGALSPEQRSQLEGLGKVVPLPLDTSSDASVAAAAAAVGGEVDIFINNADPHHRPAATEAAIDAARRDMDVHYFGLMRLAQAFGPRMRARNAAGDLGAVAWVNMLSIHALASSLTNESFSAAAAAAHSLSQSLRAQMQAAGIRVVNVFPGPIDAGTGAASTSNGLSVMALAGSVVRALQLGVEDVYPGEIAEHWFARWRENPKGLERELAAAAL